MEPETGIINDAITIASNIEKPKPSPKAKWAEILQILFEP
jgi:hypothetical protein